MSVVNLNAVFVDHNNVPVKQDEVDFTLKDALIIILINEIQGDKETGPEKLKRYNLRKKISNADGTIELSSEEKVYLKDRAAKTYGSEINGQINDFLENSSN